MKNNTENQQALKDKEVPCCWSEVDNQGKHITNCPNTPTTLDKDNHQIRYFCDEHLKKVEQIRYEMYLKLKSKYEKTTPITKMYLIKYNVSYLPETTKYKLFSKYENAVNFHKTYKHHILNDENVLMVTDIYPIAFITHYEIIVLDIDTTEKSYEEVA